MAATTAGVKGGSIARSCAGQVAKGQGRRHINPRAGRTLELLGHAIEYLTDEYFHEKNRFSSNDSQVAAIQLLMRLNREVYYECPVVRTLGERLRSFLGIASD